MAFYLVTAEPKRGSMDELGARLGRDEFIALRPFGKALTYALKNARLRDGVAVWEEEDYCEPLAQERDAVLDDYFDNLKVEKVEQDAG